MTVESTSVGTVVAGKYRVMRLLGSGGMGAVYEAENLRTGRHVAIKMLSGEAHSATVYERFLREARAAARVVHPNIVQVLDTDQDPADGMPFIVQEYLDGRDLRRVLDERHTLPWREACELMLPVMDGVIAAHSAGIVHRDLKPENIFVARGPDGTTAPKVIDFGIAKLLEAEAESANLTRTGVALGTPAYMSPEQARGLRDLDAQTDVWALGVVLYELVSGMNPFARPIANAVIAAILMDPIDALSDVVPGLPLRFVDIVHRALDRNRVRRYQSVTELRDAVREALADPDAMATARVDAAPRVSREERSDQAYAPTLAVKSDVRPSPADSNEPIAVASRAPTVRSSSRRWTLAGAALLVVVLPSATYWIRTRAMPANTPVQAANVASAPIPIREVPESSGTVTTASEPNGAIASTDAGSTLSVASPSPTTPANSTPPARPVPVTPPRTGVHGGRAAPTAPLSNLSPVLRNR